MTCRLSTVGNCGTGRGPRYLRLGGGSTPAQSIRLRNAEACGSFELLHLGKREIVKRGRRRRRRLHAGPAAGVGSAFKRSRNGQRSPRSTLAMRSETAANHGAPAAWSNCAALTSTIHRSCSYLLLGELLPRQFREVYWLRRILWPGRGSYRPFAVQCHSRRRSLNHIVTPH